jgi:hypothetical protein
MYVTAVDGAQVGQIARQMRASVSYELEGRLSRCRTTEEMSRERVGQDVNRYKADTRAGSEQTLPQQQ